MSQQWIRISRSGTTTDAATEWFSSETVRNLTLSNDSSHSHMQSPIFNHLIPDGKTFSLSPKALLVGAKSNEPFSFAAAIGRLAAKLEKNLAMGFERWRMATENRHHDPGRGPSCFLLRSGPPADADAVCGRRGNKGGRRCQHRGLQCSPEATRGIVTCFP